MNPTVPIYDRALWRTVLAYVALVVFYGACATEKPSRSNHSSMQRAYQPGMELVLKGATRPLDVDWDRVDRSRALIPQHHGPLLRTLSSIFRIHLSRWTSRILWRVQRQGLQISGKAHPGMGGSRVTRQGTFQRVLLEEYEVRGWQVRM
ncbi:MAG: hypothetical protein QM784_10105 [Polyangiaceae bacterium]